MRSSSSAVAGLVTTATTLRRPPQGHAKTSSPKVCFWRGKEAKVFQAQGLDVAGASKVIVDMEAHVAAGGLAVGVIESVVSKQAGIPVALAADAVVLCVQLGATEVSTARKTMELIGPQKFVGAITVEGAR